MEMRGARGYAAQMNVQFRSLDVAADWPVVSQHLDTVPMDNTTGIVAWDANTGDYLAIMVTDSWTPNSVDAHIVILNPFVLRHDFLEVCFSYVFGHSGRKKMFGQVRSDNPAALSFDKRLGFTEVARLTDVYADGVDNIILELHRDDCRYWQEEHRSVSNG